jgi:hypothetical protein
MVIAGVETIHLSYLPSVIIATTYKRLSSVSRSRMRSESAVPFRTFTLFRIAVGGRSHTVFAQRGSKMDIESLRARLPARQRDVNREKCYKIVGMGVTTPT